MQKRFFIVKFSFARGWRLAHNRLLWTSQWLLGIEKFERRKLFGWHAGQRLLLSGSEREIAPRSSIFIEDFRKSWSQIVWRLGELKVRRLMRLYESLTFEKIFRSWYLELPVNAKKDAAAHPNEPWFVQLFRSVAQSVVFVRTDIWRILVCVNASLIHFSLFKI